jgi:hypothetical protein
MPFDSIEICAGAGGQALGLEQAGAIAPPSDGKALFDLMATHHWHGRARPCGSGRKIRLHIGRIIDKSLGGIDEPANLRSVCSVCNEGASNAAPTRPDLQKPLLQARRASAHAQIEVLKWPMQKFPKLSTLAD